MKITRLSVAILAMLVGLGACATFDAGTTHHPDVRGRVMSIRSVNDGRIMGSILIEGNRDPDTQVDKASVSITTQTRIWERNGGNLQSASFAALQVGQRVQAAFTGPVAESYPVQATASEIVILH